MAKHPFDGPENGPCRYRRDGEGGPCGFNRLNEIHNMEPPVATGPAEAIGRVRSVPAGRQRRSMPWNELPAPSKAILVIVVTAAGALLLSVVATACRLILSAGGWLG